MSRDWCMRCYGDDRRELDEHGLCSHCDRFEILESRVADLESLVEELIREKDGTNQ